jgi:uncharacterized protein YbjT (DUF2867 family)
MFCFVNRKFITIMLILLTGANGYIGMRLLPVLVEAGHEVTCVVRDSKRFTPVSHLLSRISIVEFDFLLVEKIAPVFKGKQFDAAYYLIHSLSDKHGALGENEKKSVQSFVEMCSLTGVKQIIYLSGITNAEHLSPHLTSRKTVKDVLSKSGIPFTIFEAGIILGSGSASFEIIRNLVEKLPVMVAPRWLNTKCQPIAIRNVIHYLCSCLHNEKTLNKIFEIGGPDVLTYKQMLLQFAKVRGIKRHILIIPVSSNITSAYFIYFVTSANLAMAKQLIKSMQNDMVDFDYSVREIMPQYLYTYEEAIEMAFKRIEQNMVVSSWKDAASSSLSDLEISEYIEVPHYGCYKDKRFVEINPDNLEEVADRFFGIGGSNGWYYADSLWHLRGFIDKLFGGVGLKRGRRSESEIQPGDALDFWRVLLVDRRNHRLLLFAEMKLPGEAWLEFSIVRNKYQCILTQTATFRPHGIVGRNYWFLMLPFHYFIFRNMIKRIGGLKR